MPCVCCCSVEAAKHVSWAPAACRQLEGAAFQAQLSVIALCDGLSKRQQLVTGLDTWCVKRIMQQNLQQAGAALAATWRAASMGAKGSNPMASMVMLTGGVFRQLKVSGRKGLP